MIVLSVGIFAAKPFSTLRAATFTLEEATIEQIQAAMKAGALSSVELNSMYLNRIAVYDQTGLRVDAPDLAADSAAKLDGGKLNSVAAINPLVFSEAQTSDERRARGLSRGSLEGIPVLLKDSTNTVGIPTTVGLAAFLPAAPIEDAEVVKAFRAAGAVIQGKANMDSLAWGDGYGSTSFGFVFNPYNRRATTGGSSTGSAVALAANLTVLATGGDTGCSIRTPAAFVNVVGVTPSKNLVPKRGTFAARPNRDVIGPMARTVADVAHAMDAIAVDDPLAIEAAYFPAASAVRPPSYSERLDAKALAGKLVGLPKPYIGKDATGEFSNCPLLPDVQARFDEAVLALQRAGATVVEIDWPFIHNWYQDTPAGVDNGFDAFFANAGFTSDEFFIAYDNIAAFYINASTLALNLPGITSFAEVDSTDPLGGETWAFYKGILRGEEPGYASGDYATNNFNRWFSLLAQFRQRDITAVMTAAGVDLVAFPTTQYAGFSDYSFSSDYWSLNGGQWNCAGVDEVNWFGMPQVVVPMGETTEGNPTGLTLMTKEPYTEDQMLAFAYAFEQASKFRRAPALTPPLPGETIEYSTATPPSSRPEVSAPAVRVSASAKVTGKGRKATLVLSGRAVDASGVASLKVYVNGKKVSAKRARNWKATLKLSALRQLVRGDAKTVNVQVVARDIYGNTSVATKTVKLPKDV